MNQVRRTARTALNFFRETKFLIFGIVDALLIGASIFFSFLIRFEGVFPSEYYKNFLLYAAALAVPTIFFIWRKKLYAFNWKFVGLHELINVLKAVSLGSAVFAAIIFTDRDTTNIFAGFPRSIIIISYILNLLFIGGVRIAKRAWLEVVTKKESVNAPHALIVGAGTEGEQLIRNIIKLGDTITPVGIVDNTSKIASIHGVRILGTIEDIPRIVREKKIEQIIIALGAAEGEIIRMAARYARESGVKNVKIIPSTHEILSGKVTLTDLREIQIEDLLGRNPARIETRKIEDFIRGKNVLVTGAAGSIGSELARQISQFDPKELVILDINESDLFDLHQEFLRTSSKNRITPIIANITNRKKIFSTLGHYKPDIVFHAAAYKHVPLMEEFPDEAVRTNIFGTLNVAEAALEAGTEKFILVSTDKAIRPVSVMGKAKRGAEIVVQALNEHKKTKFAAVRFGNVIGSRGSVVPLFQKQIKHRAPITVTHPDMTRYFMTIPEAAMLIMEAGAVGDGGEIFILDMGKPVKINDLAREMIRLAGLIPDIDIPIVYTGIRPGEKIFEEIFNEEEKSVGATQWDKIFITKSMHIKSLSSIKAQLLPLGESLQSSNPNDIRSALDSVIAE